MRCGINYVMDGPCGNCPRMFICKTEECIHWAAWDEITDTILQLIEEVSA